MNFDAVTRRYQVAVFGGMILLAAYFQASGLGQLVAGHLVPAEAVKPPPASVLGAETVAKKSGAEILARNPFDSVTGPLDGSGQEPVDGPPDGVGTTPVVKSNGDPYADPECSGVRASLVTAAEDHRWSFASLSYSGEDKLRRIGDKLGSFTVQHIGYYESTERSEWDIYPHVWLVNGASRCIVSANPAEVTAPKAGVPDVTKPPTKTASKKAKIEADVKSKIKKIGENQYEVDKSGVELIIQHYAKLAGSMRGKATKDGMKLTGIREGSIMHELGMKTGDMLQSINGFDMSDPDKAVDAYAKLRRAGKLDISVVRDGAPFTVGVQIK